MNLPKKSDSIERSKSDKLFSPVENHFNDHEGKSSPEAITRKAQFIRNSLLINNILDLSGIEIPAS